MDRRDGLRRQYRRALVPALALSIVAHALVLGFGAFDVPLWDADDGADRDRAERFEDRSLQVVAVRPAEDRAEASARATGAASRSRALARSTAAPAAPAPQAASAVRSPRSARLTAEPVPVPAPAATLSAGERRDERLSATELASLFPGSDQMPRPTSRAARRVSGEHRDVGDRFATAGGARQVGPRGGGCTVNPGTIIDRRLPEGLTIGG